MTRWMLLGAVFLVGCQAPPEPQAVCEHITNVMVKEAMGVPNPVRADFGTEEAYLGFQRRVKNEISSCVPELRQTYASMSESGKTRDLSTRMHCVLKSDSMVQIQQCSKLGGS